jgi:hypothetical protein
MFANQFKSLFDSVTIEKYREQLLLLELKNKEEESRQEQFLKKAAKKQKESTKATPAVNDKKEGLNQSQDSASTDTNNKSQVSKPYKRNSFFRWVFGPVLFLSAATGLFFLLKYKNRF